MTIDQPEEPIKWAKNPFAFVSVIFKSDIEIEVEPEVLMNYLMDYNEMSMGQASKWLVHLLHKGVLVSNWEGLIRYSPTATPQP